MKVERILETVVYAEDLKAAEVFYTEVLGLQLHSRVEKRHLFFRCGSGMFLLFNPLVTEKEKFPHGSHGIGHVCWAVKREELESWRQWFKQWDVPLIEEMSWPQRGNSLYFHDPAGNNLELAAAGPVWGIQDS
ncbi:MAG: VOC family protein [Verrucomicrobiota bacterium]